MSNAEPLVDPISRWSACMRLVAPLGPQLPRDPDRLRDVLGAQVLDVHVLRHGPRGALQVPANLGSRLDATDIECIERRVGITSGPWTRRGEQLQSLSADSISEPREKNV